MGIGTRIVQRLEALKWERKDLIKAIYDASGKELSAQALSNLITRDSARSEWDELIAAGLNVHVMWLVYGREPVTYESTPNVRRLQVDQPTLPTPLDKILAAARNLNRDGQHVLLGRALELAETYAAKQNHVN